MAHQYRILLLLLSFFLFAPSNALADDAASVVVTVARNDNLINICSKLLEEPGRWPEIGRINRLKNYNLIRSGSRLTIPLVMLKGITEPGRAVFIRGKVELRENGTWKLLRENDLARQGDMIRTGNDGVAEIVFDDGTTLFIKPDSALDLKISQVKGGNHLLQNFILSAGRIVAKVRRALGRDSRIEIRTPSATASVRGTDFRVSGTEDATTAEVLQGLVDVEAARRKVKVREGEGTRVERGKPPLPPRKLLPPPVVPELPSPCRMPLIIELERVESAVGYRFQLSRDREGKDVILEKVIGSRDKLEVSGLDDGTYFFQTRSIDEMGLEGPSDPPRELKVRVHPLPPIIQNPAEGLRHKGKTLSFRWLKVPDAERYQLEVSSDREFRTAPVITRETKGTGSEVTFGDLGSYFFRIRSVAPDGYAGIWSDVIAFDIVPPPPTPTVEKPETEGKELRLRWQDLGRNFTYHLQIAREEGFSHPFVDLKVDRAEATVPMPDKPGTYYVRTSAIDTDGYESGFSSPQIFEVKRRWPIAAGILGGAAILLLVLL